MAELAEIGSAGTIWMSMVVPSLGRTDEVDRLFASLAAQGRRDIEVILVDQNTDDRLDPIVHKHAAALSIDHLKTASMGACRARNFGSRHARGEWLIFPDDDCWYPAGFLDRIDRLIGETGADFISGRAAKETGETIMGIFSTDAGPILRPNIWTTLIEWMVAIRKTTFDAAGGFDDRLGPGAGTPWGGYEIQDLILKCLRTGASGHFDPQLVGHHPDDRVDQTLPAAIAKMRKYSAGLGYVMRKHGYAFAEFLPRLTRPLLGAAVYTLTARPAMAKRSSQIFLGRLSGWQAGGREA